MPLLGKDAKTYYSDDLLDGDSTTVATATWVEVTNIGDETDNFTAEEVDTTTRETAEEGWGSTIFTVKQGEVTFTILMETGDVFTTKLLNAYFNSAAIALLFLTGDKDDADSIGVGGNWSVSMSFPKPVKGIQTADVTVRTRSKVETVLASTA